MSNQAHELSDQDIDKVFKTVDIPACPAMVSEVMAEAQKDIPDIRKLARTISADAAMTAVTIKLANSPLFRVGSAVSTVQQALDRIGMRNTVCIIIAAALRSAMAGSGGAFIEKFWNKSAALALAAGMIARKQYGISPDAAYIYALFHDAGIPMMMRRFPEYEKALEECQTTGKLLIDIENQYFPCTHPIIGFLMIRNWGLPALIGKAIQFHHEPDVYDLPNETLPGGALSLIAVTHLAEHISNDIDSEVDLEVGPALYARALVHFGIHEEDVEALREAIMAARAET